MFAWIWLDFLDTADLAKSEYKDFLNDQVIVTELATFDVVLGKLMQSRTHL